MSTIEFLSNPVLSRAAVLGLFGGAGLVLTTVYSRRGPMIYPVYAAFLAALTLLLARYPTLSYATRVTAALAGFMVASTALSVASDILATRQRRALVEAGRLPSSALSYRPSVAGYVARFLFLLVVGGVISAGVAFVAA